VKRKLMVVACALFLAAIAVPTTLRADIWDPPPGCGGGCTPPGVTLHLGN